jgi:hypothetical protein
MLLLGYKPSRAFADTLPPRHLATLLPTVRNL